MEKLKCIKNRNTGECQRLYVSDCRNFIEKSNGIWHYTSKSAYAAYLKSLEPTYPSGYFRSSRKNRKQGRIKFGNNRKYTRGREFMYLVTHPTKVFAKITGWLMKHSAIQHKEVRPHERTTVISKEGKGETIPMTKIVAKETVVGQTKGTSRKVISNRTDRVKNK